MKIVKKMETEKKKRGQRKNSMEGKKIHPYVRKQFLRIVNSKFEHFKNLSLFLLKAVKLRD